ncbi:aminotransferase class I/II-fold pyridoxal phosphate-dependent enzyme [Prochlorococcus sp. MIT 1307]|uniref:aminotransferase class I/II-fold pyridoxal phosphate-dependent enzyme n=1 Tax=Prochlorococcus sp. MIT 1307 TaxID=3096219 RepID=UPI002A7582D2|nr:aminotransferase class I/II-fold pyridoxal phosphate-dependent enzyme [Prochlorococcus sp. MIT 1307]
MGIASLLTFNRGKSLFLPAHGRGVALPTEIKKLLGKRAGLWDLPELPDLGGPLISNGAVAASQERSACGVGAKRCWYGVNGATGLLQAALLSITRPGQAVLMPRNIHRSLIQACAISELQPVLYDVPFMADRGHFGTSDAFWIQKVLNALPLSEVDIAATVLINPTYHGYTGDLTSLVKIFHERGWPVLVDEAHGAHFASRVDMDLPASGLSAGADLVVHSLHKSAAGLVQTAVLWLQGDRVDPIAVERSVSWLQTSSPSALLLASCESALSEWKTKSGQSKLITRINEARQISTQLRNMGVPLLLNQDPLRLIVHSASKGISGFDADNWLIQHGIVGELPEPGCLTLCLGFAPQKGLARRFKRNWNALLASHPDRKPLPAFVAPPVPLLMTPMMSCAFAWRSKSHTVPLNEAVGRVAAEMICPYPPGIPILIPGESLEKAGVKWLLQQRSLWPDQIPSHLRVVNQ